MKYDEDEALKSSSFINILKKIQLRIIDFCRRVET